MLKSFLFKLKDNRRVQGKRYALGHILLFTILGILSGAKSYRKVASFIDCHYQTLDETFELGWKGLPAYTTIRAIIQGTEQEELETQFRQYSQELDESETDKRHVIGDGKVLRGSFDQFADQSAIQLLSFFAGESQIILAHEEIEAKTNEIPTVRELMKKLGLTDCIYTFDALHCQEETLTVAKETDNDVIVQVKGNQKILHNDCQVLADTQTPDDAYKEPFNKTRNRIESRSVEVFLNPELTDQDKWQNIDSVVRVQRFRQVFDTRSKTWKDTHETAFFVSTIQLDAQDFCHIIRQHWGIENANHYVRDVTLGEDQSRIRCNPSLFARLRSFALNILRRNHVQNISQELFDNCMDIHRVLNYHGVL